METPFTHPQRPNGELGNVYTYFDSDRTDKADALKARGVKFRCDKSPDGRVRVAARLVDGEDIAVRFIDGCSPMSSLLTAFDEVVEGTEKALGAGQSSKP